MLLPCQWQDGNASTQCMRCTRVSGALPLLAPWIHTLMHHAPPWFGLVCRSELEIELANNKLCDMRGVGNSVVTRSVPKASPFWLGYDHTCTTKVNTDAHAPTGGADLARPGQLVQQRQRQLRHVRRRRERGRGGRPHRCARVVCGG